MFAKTVNSRYHIGDGQCGLVDLATTKAEADRIATKHSEECEGVTYYDVMARRGAPQEWKPGGEIVSRREETECQ